jgi:hypothetical protein
LKDLDVDGRKILKWLLKNICWAVLDLVNLAHYRKMWRALVNTVMNIFVV